MTIEDKNVLGWKACQAGDGRSPALPAVVIVVNGSEIPYEVLLTADELQKMLDACDPERAKPEFR